MIEANTRRGHRRRTGGEPVARTGAPDEAVALPEGLGPTI